MNLSFSFSCLTTTSLSSYRSTTRTSRSETSATPSSSLKTTMTKTTSASPLTLEPTTRTSPTFPTATLLVSFDARRSAIPLALAHSFLFAGTIDSRKPGDGSCVTNPCWYTVNGTDGTQAIIFDFAKGTGESLFPISLVSLLITPGSRANLVPHSPLSPLSYQHCHQQHQHPPRRRAQGDRHLRSRSVAGDRQAGRLCVP